MKNKLNVGIISLGVGARHAQILYKNKKLNLVRLYDFDNKKIFKNCNLTDNSDDIF